MERGSARSGIRRQGASPGRCCARLALLFAFAFVGFWQAASGDSPTLPLPPPEPPASAAAPGESDDLQAALQRRGDLKLHGLSLNAALFMIGEQWNINIVAGELHGNVNGVFKQAPLYEILDSILLSNGYNYRAVGKSLVISKTDDLGKINPFFQSATIAVRSADIDEVVEGARLLSTPQGQVRPLKSARSIVVLDFPDRVEMIREFVGAIDGASGRGFPAADGHRGFALDVGHYRTQHIPARTAEHALQAVLSKDGRVAVLEGEDRLVVTDHAENLAMVERVLSRVDQPRPQVRITALIYDVSLQDIERLGFHWNKLGYRSGDQSRLGLAIDPIATVPLALDPSGSVAVVEGSTIAFGALSRHWDIHAVVSALQGASDARLLANPSVAVNENMQAIFKSVSEIPYQQLTETQQGGNIGTTAFKEAGITLTVTPKIAADGTISMIVAPEFSRLAGFTPGDNQPIIDTRSASTALTIADRQTVVIGGLRERRDIGDFNGIPYLKDMKWVGGLFRSRSTNVRESELVVFIYPEIISCADEPTRRQQIALETIDCRLNQIPEAEGCPPWCRRLPPDLGGPVIYVEPPVDEELLPLSAAQIPSAELQFGAAGRAENVRTLVKEGKLRRLPAVEPSGEGRPNQGAPPLRR